MKKCMECMKTRWNRFVALLKRHPPLQYVIFGGMLAIMGLGPYFGIIPVSTAMFGALITVMIWTVAALGINLLLGYGGLISLATAGFMGVGALGVGIFMTEYGWPFELAALMTLLISGALGLLIGIFSLKVSGIYLAIGTLFVGEILRRIFTNVPIFGGERINIGEITFLGRFTIDRNLPFQDFATGASQYERYWLYLILTVLMVLTMIVVHNIVKSRTGRAFMAMSRSENAAQSMGISIIKYRLIAFIVATMLATLGGIMYAIYFQNAPTEAWTLILSLMIIGAVVVGGLKSIFGTFLGAVIIHLVPNLYLRPLFGDVRSLFTGVLIIVVILFYPRGVVFVVTDLKKLWGKLKKRLQGRKETAHDEQS